MRSQPAILVILVATRRLVMMVPEITQIQQSLDQLAQKTVELTQKVHEQYGQYLALLGPAVSQKLVQASYHLCTQVNPDSFLKLSLNQQQTLQQEVQRLGTQLQEALKAVTQPLAELTQEESVDPEHLSNLLQDMEQAILDALRQISQQANECLQEYDIVNISSMDLLFDIASKAAEQGRPITSAPHLIKALMDDQNDDSSEDSSDPVVAIFLQLSDLEFTDIEVMNERHQLRQLWQQLKTIRESFHKKQREKTVAEATAAWRASWFPAEVNE
ncbi:hypothetical protein HRE53_13920 [Acaryochloris sp. 'Moss Beach']|uniref:hypothetical protein n=1 Tax=Acaryochloris sp. 'Moss Beach' TaxID=2740837 RepID=UPI001F392742|nr:hypothetical protein [Acaryochloris sp. 'Moss Beach']UJB67769.1 hypothetical protein HRE53_13920 [Acaryochloris sp. 'Moss Beach']